MPRKLEEIKEIIRTGYADHLRSSDWEWLIEQAEKVEQLNSVIQVDRHEYKELNDRLIKLKEEIELLDGDLHVEKEHVKELEHQAEHWKKCTESEQNIAGKLQKKVEQLREEKAQAYHDGYKQGRFDEKMDSLNCEVTGFSEDDAFSRSMELAVYTKVRIVDWLGKEGIFEIIRLVDKENDKYSCTFKNSIGDHETALVDELDLIP